MKQWPDFHTCKHSGGTEGHCAWALPSGLHDACRRSWGRIMVSHKARKSIIQSETSICTLLGWDFCEVEIGGPLVSPDEVAFSFLVQWRWRKVQVALTAWIWVGSGWRRAGVWPLGCSPFWPSLSCSGPHTTPAQSFQFCGLLTHRYYSCFLEISPWTYSHL